MATAFKSTDAESKTYVLPHYLRFARTLALVSSAAVGIATGAAVISSVGCVCSGTPCGGQLPPPYHADASPDVGVDAGHDVITVETAPDTTLVDGGIDAGDTGGGPRPAPVLPRAWVA